MQKIWPIIDCFIIFFVKTVETDNMSEKLKLFLRPLFRYKIFKFSVDCTFPQLC